MHRGDPVMAQRVQGNTPLHGVGSRQGCSPAAAYWVSLIGLAPWNSQATEIASMIATSLQQLFWQRAAGWHRRSRWRPAIRALLAVALASPSISHGLALRGVELGATCQEALEHEIAGGARPIAAEFMHDSMQRGGPLGFEDPKTPGEYTEVLYSCDHSGHVDLYGITIFAREQSQAQEIYSTIKRDLESRLGSPPVDSDTANVMLKLLLQRAKKLSLSRWEKGMLGDETVSVSLEWGKSIPVASSPSVSSWDVNIIVAWSPGKRAPARSEETPGQRIPPPPSVSQTDNQHSVAAASQSVLAAPVGDIITLTAIMAGDGKVHGFRLLPGRDSEAFARLGFHPGDLLTAINGASVAEPARFSLLQFTEMVRVLSSPGDVRVTILRNGQPEDLMLNLPKN
jgi:hypothetical protein